MPGRPKNQRIPGNAPKHRWVFPGEWQPHQRKTPRPCLSAPTRPGRTSPWTRRRTEPVCLPAGLARILRREIVGAIQGIDREAPARRPPDASGRREKRVAVANVKWARRFVDGHDFIASGKDGHARFLVAAQVGDADLRGNGQFRKTEPQAGRKRQVAGARFAAAGHEMF